MEVKTFFLLQITMILGKNREIGDEMEVKTFLFFRDHHDFGEEVVIKIWPPLGNFLRTPLPLYVSSVLLGLQ